VAGESARCFCLFVCLLITRFVVCVFLVCLFVLCFRVCERTWQALASAVFAGLYVCLLLCLCVYVFVCLFVLFVGSLSVSFCVWKGKKVRTWRFTPLDVCGTRAEMLIHQTTFAQQVLRPAGASAADVSWSRLS
jgi:hypothetical protein